MNNSLIWYGRILNVVPVGKRDHKSAWRESYIGKYGIITFPETGDGRNYMNYIVLEHSEYGPGIRSIFHTGASETPLPGPDYEGHRYTFQTRKSIYDLELIKRLGGDTEGFTPIDELMDEIRDYLSKNNSDSATSCS